jgi:hypothetical protein
MDENVIIALFMDEKMAFQFSVGMVMASNHGRVNYFTFLQKK